MRTSKLVLLLIALCLLIMASVIYYHYSHPQKPIILANDHGVLFSTGRDLKPLRLTTEKQQLTEQDFTQHWTLLFFGFTHCMSICPTTMRMLSEAYPDLQKTYPNLQVILVSLDPERDTPATVANYAKRFYPAFIGATNSMVNLRKLQSQFGIIAQRDADSAPSNYQIMHTASLMLINPKAQWVGMFNYGMTAPEFVAAFQASMRELS